MDRQDLELVVELSREGTLTATAQRLHTAQPALSRRLARLERDLGVHLFERGRSGATPTPAGRVVIDAATRALRAVDDVERVARQAALGASGTLRIGTTPTLGADVLPGALARFRTERPGVRLELHASGDSTGLRAMVRVGELDLAVAVVPTALEDGLHVAWPGRQDFAVVVPADDPLARQGIVARSALVGRPVVALARGEGLRLVLEAVFAELREEPVISIETTEREMLIPFVTAGLGCTIVPLQFADQRAGQGTVVLPLDPPLRRDVGVVVRDDEVEALVWSFAELVEFD